MIDWRPIKEALYDWALWPFESVQGLVCHWDDQNLPRPAYPYLTLKRDSIIRVGGPDEVRSTTDLAQSQGEEIGLETTGAREFTLTVKAYVDEANGGIDPDCDAIALLTKLQGTLGTIYTQEAFCLIGLAVVEEMPVIDLSAERNSQRVSMAAMDIRLRATYSSVERTGYIDSTEVASCASAEPDAVTGVSFTV